MGLLDRLFRHDVVSPPRLDGGTAIVTGAARGIGKAVAAELHRRGARVVLIDVLAGALAAAVDEIGPDRVMAYTLDIRDRAALTDAVDAIVAETGRIDVVVANAGVGPRRIETLRVTDGDEFDRMIDINLKGTFNTVRAALEPVLAADGHIAVVASMSVANAGMAGSTYPISKVAVEQLGRSLRIELGPYGASAGVVYFGIVETPMMRAGLQDDPVGALTMRRIPSRLRTKTPADAAARAVVEGILARKPRTVIPVEWLPLLWIRGLIAGRSDAALAGDPRVHAIVESVDSALSEPVSPEGAIDGR